MSRVYSHSDVLVRACEQGLSYADAEALADFLCPEYNSVSVARFVNEIAKVLS